MDFVHDYIRVQDLSLTICWKITISTENRYVIISVKDVYLHDVLMFLVSPWHTASDAALHKCLPLRLCYLYQKSNILLLFDKAHRCFIHSDNTPGLDYKFITIMDVV